ncbi:MAG: ArsC/Spx/MgsR family protein, partial [Bacteroidota bacterium]
WKTLVNTKGTTYRKLSPEDQEITTQSKAVALMVANPSLIKRPVVETSTGQLLVGFDANLFASFVN